LLVAEVNHGKGGVVGHVAGPRAERRFGILRFERRDFACLAVVSVLQKGEVSLYVGNVDILTVGWKEHAMGFTLPFVHRGDGLSGNSLIIEGIDVEPSVPVTDAQYVPVFLIQAEEAGTIIKIDILMLLVGTILVQEHDRSRHFSGVSTRGGNIEKRLAWMSGDHTTGEVELHFLGNRKVETFSLRSRLDNPKSVLLRAWRIDVKGLAPKACVSDAKKEKKG
jgi:hypothetical protein